MRLLDCRRYELTLADFSGGTYACRMQSVFQQDVREVGQPAMLRQAEEQIKIFIDPATPGTLLLVAVPMARQVPKTYSHNEPR